MSGQVQSYYVCYSVLFDYLLIDFVLFGGARVLPCSPGWPGTYTFSSAGVTAMYHQAPAYLVFN